MKSPKHFKTLIILSSLLLTQAIYPQIVVNPGPAVTPEDMVEFLMGPGVSFENVSFQGAPESSGIFTNGGTTNLYLEEGVFLTSGNGNSLPGPNMSTSAGSVNGMSGHPLLNTLTSSTTYDAAVLEFDFVPMNDTVRCWYVFGSEEYNEWVGSSFNDVFGFFVTGPNPSGGEYVDENVALVPGTSNIYVAINNVNNGYASGGVVPTGPCTFCEFYDDNTFGTSLEYDGKTLVLPVTILVTPGETYHFVFAAGDVGDGIYDSGVFIKGTSFKSPGPADFFAFDFLAEDNPGLDYDVIGAIEYPNVYLGVPEGTDVTGLVATYEEHGADVFVSGVRQENGVTSNDFAEMVTYHLEGYETDEWLVHVDFITDIPEQAFQAVKIGPNPSEGMLRIENCIGMEVTVINSLGRIVQKLDNPGQSYVVQDLPAGMYFVRLKKHGTTETRKVIIR